MSEDTDLVWLQSRLKEMFNNGKEADTPEAGAGFAQAAATFALAIEVHHLGVRFLFWSTSQNERKHS